MTSVVDDGRPRGPLLARLVGGERFYGWYVAFACLILMWVTVGVSYYGLSLFLKPLRDEHGWSNAVVSAATGTFFVVSGVAGFVAGPSIDRIGARRFMAFGITLTALGAAAVGFVDRIWQLFVVYAALAIAYGLGAVVPVSTLIARWFIRHRGKAMMISSTGVSLGGATLVPIGAVLIEHGGLRLAAPVLGAVVFLIAMPVLALAVAGDPRDLGLEPDGGPGPAGSPAVDHAQFRVWSRAGAMRTSTFWAVTGAFTLAVGATTGVLIHQLAFLQEPDKLKTRGAAALAVTTTTIGSIVARSLVGLVADRMDKRLATAVLFALQAVTIAGLLAVHGTFLIYVVALLFGFTIGNVYMFQSLVVGELFGLVSFGTIYGMVVLASQIGSGIALIAVGALVDRHGYGVPFLALAALDVIAAGAALFARPPAR